MKTITLSDDIVRELEKLSARLGVSPDEIIRRGISGYLGEKSVQSQNRFESVGFGMWAGRNGDHYKMGAKPVCTGSESRNKDSFVG